MSKGIPLNVLWDALDEKYKFIASDEDDEGNREWYAYTRRPYKSETNKVWINKQEDARVFSISRPIDAMHDVPWDQTLIERPIPIQEGAFGKFWCGEEEPEDRDADWGYLISIDYEDTLSTYESYGNWWTHFIPKIPAPLIEM